MYCHSVFKKNRGIELPWIQIPCLMPLLFFSSVTEKFIFDKKLSNLVTTDQSIKRLVGQTRLADRSLKGGGKINNYLSIKMFHFRIIYRLTTNNFGPVTSDRFGKRSHDIFSHTWLSKARGKLLAVRFVVR